jgi:hypothetical protein
VSDRPRRDLRRVPDAGAPEDAENDAPPSGDAIDRWVLPYLHDSSLWPVLLVVMAHVVAFVAPVLLFAVRDRHYAAIAATIGLVYLTTGVVRYDLKKSSRPAALTAVALIIWVASVTAAYYGGALGLL